MEDLPIPWGVLFSGRQSCSKCCPLLFGSARFTPIDLPPRILLSAAILTAQCAQPPQPVFPDSSSARHPRGAAQRPSVMDVHHPTFAVLGYDYKARFNSLGWRIWIPRFVVG